MTLKSINTKVAALKKGSLRMFLSQERLPRWEQKVRLLSTERLINLKMFYLIKNIKFCDVSNLSVIKFILLHSTTIKANQLKTKKYLSTLSSLFN